MSRILRGLSIGYLLAASAFGAMIAENRLLIAGVPERGGTHLRALDAKIPKAVPLRGSMDTDAPLLLPFQAPEGAPKSPRKYKASSGMQFAALPLLDTEPSAG